MVVPPTNGDSSERGGEERFPNPSDAMGWMLGNFYQERLGLREEEQDV